MASSSLLHPPPELPEAVCRQAAQWLVEMQAEHVSPSAEMRWRRWRAADPLHEQAWQRLESCMRSLDALPLPVAARTLATAAGKGRRRALKALALLVLGAGGGAAVLQTPPGRRWRADHHTATAEHRRVRLADNGEVTLAAGSAIDVRYTDTERRIHVVQGEIFVESVPDPLAQAGRAARPLEVTTRHGLVRTMDARFSVRQLPDSTLACVFTGSLELCPAQARDDGVLLHGGQQAYFDPASVTRRQAIDQTVPGWLEGMLVADDMRLADFRDMLQAYHRGVLSWSAQAGALRLSGTYPFSDTDAVLHAMAALLPIRLHEYAGLWTRIDVRES